MLPEEEKQGAEVLEDPVSTEDQDSPEDIQQGFQDGFKDADQVEPPLPTPTPQVEEKASAEGAEEGEAKADSEESTTDPEPEPVEESPTKSLEDKIRAMESRTGNLYKQHNQQQEENQALRSQILQLENQLKQTPPTPPEVEKLNPEAILNQIKSSDSWKELDEFNPTTKTAMEHALTQIISNIPVPQAPQTAPAAPAPLDPRLDSLAQREKDIAQLIERDLARSIEPIVKKYPTVMEDVKSPQYANWLSFQNEEVRNMINGNNPDQWSKGLDMYYDAVKQFSPTEKRVTRNGDNSNLREALPATGKLPSSGPSPKGEDKDDAHTGFHQGFAEVD